MRVINARNVQQAFPQALLLLDEHGVHRESRYGPVIVAPWPVSTVYSRPNERVLFYPDRDANPFFHLAESIWMLMGKNDVKTPAVFAKQIKEFSDDGVTLHDAYGYRWRHWFGSDQIVDIILELRKNHDNRRCVLQMWEPNADLGRTGKAVPCNLTATFQIGVDGRLDMVVFNRSNDIVWGCYGANAVHFSMLQEYIAAKVEVPVGTYTQVSANWHAYVKVIDTVQHLKGLARDPLHLRAVDDPYETGSVSFIPMEPENLSAAYRRVTQESPSPVNGRLWLDMVTSMMNAHLAWRTLTGEDRYREALHCLDEYTINADWIVAGKQWIQRRYDRWLAKQAGEFNTLGEA